MGLSTVLLLLHNSTVVYWPVSRITQMLTRSRKMEYDMRNASDNDESMINMTMPLTTHKHLLASKQCYLFELTVARYGTVLIFFLPRSIQSFLPSNSSVCDLHLFSIIYHKFDILLNSGHLDGNILTDFDSTFYEL